MKHFYGVHWGENRRVSQKVDDPRSACLDCYGIVTADMEVKDLGTRRDKVRKSLNEPEGWVRMG